MDRQRRSLPAIRTAHLIGWCLTLIASAHPISAEPPSQAQSAARPPPENPLVANRELYRPDQLIVKLDRDRVEPLDLADGSALSAVLLRYGAVERQHAFVGFNSANARVSTAKQSAERAKRHFPKRAARHARQPVEIPDLEKIFLVQLEQPTDILQAVSELLALPGVEYAEPNLLFHTMATPLPNEAFLPDDRYISEDGVHWSEGAWGQAFFDLWGIEKLDAIEAWNQFDLSETKPGENVVVAVIDSGLDSDHPDIVDNVWHNDDAIPADGIDDDGNGLVDDLRGWDFVGNDADPEDGFGHGTHVAGTVAARGNNQIGVIGVAPWALIMPLKGLSDSGLGNSVNLANAVRYAADMGADVISASWGGSGPSATLDLAFRYARNLGVISVAAAGNSDADVGNVSPANFDTVLAIAATDPDDVKAPFSNHGSLIDLSAPGVDVLSINANVGDNAIAEAFPERVVADDYLHLSGTSMACPHASGAVAVLLSQDPNGSMTDIRGRLLAGAESIADLNPGFEDALGWGRVNLLASLTAEPQPLLETVAIDTGGAAPGKDTKIAVHLQNLWVAVYGVSATLSTESTYASVSKQGAVFGDILPDQVVDNVGDPFEVTIDASTPIGEDIHFNMTLNGDDGYSEVIHLLIEIRHFEDVSRKTGLPLFDLIPWNVALQDYDGDGDTDAQWIGFANNNLYQNSGGSFTEAGGAGGVGTSFGLFLDIDNDGDQDRFLAGFDNIGSSELLLNIGGGIYSDITDASGIRDVRAFTAAALDYDGDGWVDFLASSNFDSRAKRPEGLFLMRNNGDGTFTDVAPRTCIDPQSRLGLGQMLVFDYDNDADSDLLFASTEDVSLYENNGDGTYSDVAVQAGLSPGTRSKRSCERHSTRARRPDCPKTVAMGGAVGDYDNDGDLDVFITGRSAATAGSSSLYRNDGSGSFTDVTADSGDLAAGGVSGLWWGNAFFDFDNDGDLDLYVTGEGFTEIRTNTLYQNDGAGRFTRVTDLAFPSDTGPSGATAAIGDYNDDGALDIYAPAGALGSGGLGAFYENLTGQRKHWIVVRLRGTLSHRDAFGARVTVTADGKTQLRELHTSPVDPRSLHFGLGEATSADEVRVRWPSGIVQTVRDASADQVLVISEPLECDADSEDIAECPTPQKFPRERRSANSSDRLVCTP